VVGAFVFFGALNKRTATGEGEFRDDSMNGKFIKLVQVCEQTYSD
jgi:hypothetical protein